MALSLANWIRISLLAAMRGLADVNTSALALFTDEVPIPSDFGVFRVYLSPDGVAQDFGTNSVTYRLATKVFMQAANILTGGGFLIVIPRLQNAPASKATIVAASINLNALPDGGGTLRVILNGDDADPVDIDFTRFDKSNLEALEESLNTAAAEAGIVFTLFGDIGSAELRISTAEAGAAVSLEIAEPAMGTNIAPLLGIAGRSAAGTAVGLESLKDAILRTSVSVPYFGIISTAAFDDNSEAVLEDIADTVQSMSRIFFAASAAGSLIPGAFKDIKDMGLSHTRCLFYSRSEDGALDFMAGYASRALSCNFAGTLTAFTMHGKDIVGLKADEISQTVLQACQNNGVDVYPDFGIPKVFTSGANMFYDQVYNRLAITLRIQIAIFNYLATAGTKIPQVESGMDGLKGEVRKILAMFVVNGVLAPGEWTSPVVYGIPEDHHRNIKAFGYYIYSIPLAQQAQADRKRRVAPLMQVAAKEAGAIHSGDLTIYVEE